jgi:release factor glutamine methyltransferase
VAVVQACRHGLCGVYGQHWGGPEGDQFGRAARRFEAAGVAALLVNCIPPDHVDGMVSYLRDFTDVPIGVYPNLGYFTDEGWRFEAGVDGEEFARHALAWRREGAQVIGGCCGVGPDHIAAASKALAGTAPGRERPAPIGLRNGAVPPREASLPRSDWLDERGRELFPLALPSLAVEEGVSPPGDEALLVWRFLARERIGAGQRCLDVGCGAGLLSVQLAVNGAAHVHSIDVDPAAVRSTLTNAFRSGLAGRVTAASGDLYPWVPQERYDVIVANLPQVPVDPNEAASSHRIADYWGRNLVDQLIAKLPDALDEDGVAYLMQLSILSQRRTAELLADSGYDVRVADHSLFGFDAAHEARRAQIERVEELSDGYHVELGGRDLMVGYLLEIRPPKLR